MKTKNNIVVLDGYTLNPGDLSWNELQSLGSCTIHDRTPPERVIERSLSADILLTNKTVLSSDIIAKLPHLRYIGVLATGVNVVDLTEAAKHDIIVTNVPAYSTNSVAQLVFALLLELTHHAGHHSREVRNGRWSAHSDFSFRDTPLTELYGKTFGIIGFGNIGQAVAAIASAFGMNILVSTRTVRTAGDQEARKAFPALTFTDTDSLLQQSDVVSLHCSLNDQTRLLMNDRRLRLMKPSAYLINTGRGPLVDEPALAQALNEERLAGAGLDVLSAEPPSPDNPLLTAKNCIITPHYAWGTHAARKRLMDVVVHNVRAFIDGQPMNVIS